MHIRRFIPLVATAATLSFVVAAVSAPLLSNGVLGASVTTRLMKPPGTFIIDPTFANDTEKRLDAATNVVSEIMGSPDKGIPQDLLGKAACVVVVPGVKKAAFVIGAKYGRGFIVCRKAGGGWSAPAGLRVEGGSVGFQIGGSETEIHSRRRRVCHGRTSGPDCCGSDRHPDACAASDLFARAWALRRRFVGRCDSSA